ncbi:hypothetical protein EV359DRAFT_68679, partial [Lentinula novae-zelandiae]
MSKTGQFSTMSDDQFRHVISQLPLSGRPTAGATTRATRGSSSSTPQPPPMLMLAPPSYVPQYPQGQQQPQMQMQNQTQPQTRYQHYQIPPQPQPQSQPPAVAPVAPVAGTPISSSAQAYFTSYASRLRTGATLLVQPTLFPGSTTTTASSSLPIPSTSSSSSTLGTTTRPTRASRRSRGTVINYAEVDDEGDDDEGEDDDANNTKKDGDHIPDAGALDDDVMDGDFVAGSGRRVGRPSKQQQQGRGDTSMDLDQSYLGQVPPARFIKSRGFLSNAATAQG